MPGRAKNGTTLHRNRRLQTRQLIVIFGSALAVAATVVLFAATSPGTEEGSTRTGSDASADAAPDIDMIDFDGEALKLSDLEGTPVILNFWASWCPPCIAEMPDFERVNQAAADRVIFLGINFQDDPQQATKLATETGVTYRLVRDSEGLIFREFDGLGMPTTVFIDASGSIREVVTGQMSESQLRAKIAEHFAIEV
jgi:thiol-disulfide isomerase/thioredoxin